MIKAHKEIIELMKVEHKLLLLEHTLVDCRDRKREIHNKAKELEIRLKGVGK